MEFKIRKKYIDIIDYRYMVWSSLEEDQRIEIKVNGSKIEFDKLGVKEVYLSNILGEKINLQQNLGEIDFTEFIDGIYFLQINNDTFKLIKTGGRNAQIYRSSN